MAIATLEHSSLQQISEVVDNVQKLLYSLLERKVSETLPDSPIDSEDGMALMEAMDSLLDLHAERFRNTRDSKQSTADAKSVMDSAWLGLQNVMYEKRHLLDDIVNCRAFRSVYQDVELIPLDEFRSRAPVEYLQNENDPHTLLINRLKFEFDERTRLKEEQEQLEAERIKLIRENRKAQERIDRFDKLLDDFVEASQPLQDALDEEQKREEELAAQVPAPMDTDSKTTPSPPSPSSTPAPMETDD